MRMEQEVHGDKLITKYYDDNGNLKATMESPISEQPEIPSIPQNPLLKNTADITVIKKQNANTMLSLVKQNNDLQAKVQERDALINTVKLQNSTLMLMLARNGIN